MAVKIKKVEPALPAVDESARILNEMDRLLDEMQDTMKVIKCLLNEEVAIEPSSLGDCACRRDEEAVRSS